ncbi:hypothetical protein ABIF61_003041 [Bradyrhizobium japonicum]
MVGCAFETDTRFVPKSKSIPGLQVHQTCMFPPSGPIVGEALTQL